MLLPWQPISLGLYVVSSAVALYVVFMCWKRNFAPLSVKYSTLLLVTVLIAPHLTVYDLVILAPALILLADWLMGRRATRSTRALAAVVYFVYALPLIGPFTRWTHLQFSVIAMMMTLFFVWRILASSTVPEGVHASTPSAAVEHE
jgi:hypothetical protein